MDRVKLLTSSGEFVATAIIPAFNPETTDINILTWGSRTFQRTEHPGEFKEVFSIAILKHDKIEDYE